MSDPNKLESAANYMDPTVGWDSMQPKGMPLDELMGHEDSAACACEWCGFNPGQEEDAVRRETFDRLMVYLFADRRPEAWELVARRAYAIAKSYFPHLLVITGPEGQQIPMSLEKLSIVFDEPNTKAARATWSARIQRLVTDLMKSAGSKAKASFQKNPDACEKMSQAAKGNNNRNGGKKASPPSKTNQ